MLKQKKLHFINPSSVRLTRDGRNVLIKFHDTKSEFGILVPRNYLVKVLESTPTQNDSNSEEKVG